MSPPQPDEIAALAANVEELLFAAVVARVAETTLPEPAYCVALVKMSGQLGLPVLGIGLKSERERWLAELAGKSETFVRRCRVTTRVGDTVWNPTKFANNGRKRPSLKLADKQLVKSNRALQDAVYRSGQNDVWTHEMFGRVAARLDTHAWTGVLAVTDDFIAYFTMSSWLDHRMPRTTPDRPILGALAPFTD